MLGDVEMWDVESTTSRKVTVTEKNLRQYRKLFEEYQEQVQETHCRGVDGDHSVRDEREYRHADKGRQRTQSTSYHSQ